MGTILLASLALQARTFPWRTEQANHVDLALTGLLIIVQLGTGVKDIEKVETRLEVE